MRATRVRSHRSRAPMALRHPMTVKNYATSFISLARLSSLSRRLLLSFSRLALLRRAVRGDALSRLASDDVAGSRGAPATAGTTGSLRVVGRAWPGSSDFLCAGSAKKKRSTISL